MKVRWPPSEQWEAAKLIAAVSRTVPDPVAPKASTLHVKVPIAGTAAARKTASSKTSLFAARWTEVRAMAVHMPYSRAMLHWRSNICKQSCTYFIWSMRQKDHLVEIPAGAGHSVGARRDQCMLEAQLGWQTKSMAGGGCESGLRLILCPQVMERDSRPSMTRPLSACLSDDKSAEALP